MQFYFSMYEQFDFFYAQLIWDWLSLLYGDVSIFHY